MELKVSLGPPGIPKLMVVSHERSGTHFLMNSLSLNFGYCAQDNDIESERKWIDLDMNFPINFWNAPNILDFFNMTKGHPMLNIVKSHHPIDFFKPILKEILEEYLLFYIYRNDKDVMDSCCRHYNTMEWDAGPRVANGEEYAKAIPRGGQLRYQKIQYENCWDRWERHVYGWLKYVPLSLLNKVIYVKYEELRDHFDYVINQISKKTGLILQHKEPIKPSKFENVVTPNVEEYKQLQREGKI